MDAIDSVNQSVYLDDEVCESYQGWTDLFDAEKVIIDRLRTADIPGGRILDIGIGAGRTTPHLRQISADYVGIDYSTQMVKLARQNWPDANIFERDVRDLSVFKDDEFGLVFFSFNGLDYVSHSDRLIALREIRRVLRPGGIFVFSSHNRDHAHYDRFRMRLKYSEINAVRLWRLLVGARNRLQNLKRHVYHKEYAIVTDRGHNYRLLTYYTTARDQITQLESTGFSSDVQVFDAQGHLVRKSSETDAESSWLYYLTTKASPPVTADGLRSR